jgi:hypothetical protein
MATSHADTSWLHHMLTLHGYITCWHFMATSHDDTSWLHHMLTLYSYITCWHFMATSHADTSWLHHMLTLHCYITYCHMLTLHGYITYCHMLTLHGYITCWHMLTLHGYIRNCSTCTKHLQVWHVRYWKEHNCVMQTTPACDRLLSEDLWVTCKAYNRIRPVSQSVWLFFQTNPLFSCDIFLVWHMCRFAELWANIFKPNQTTTPTSEHRHLNRRLSQYL